ncbi:MAG: ion channel [Myxococcota bacterium]
MAHLDEERERFRYSIVGQPNRPLSDLYHFLMRGSYWRLLIFSCMAYIIAIATFAVLFWLGGDCIEGAEPGRFSDMFWFSVQTFSTIGYGGLMPRTPYAHMLVLIESFIGLAGVAVVTALMYSRFARPMARLGFSEKAIVVPRDGTPTLQIRLANERHTPILDARVRVSLLVDDQTAEGQNLRRLVDLKLERSVTPLITLTWTVIHRLEGDSPLVGLTQDNVDERVIFILASFSGTDSALLQEVRTQYLYRPEEFVFGRHFMDMLEDAEEGVVMRWSNLSALRVGRAADDDTAG